MSYITIQNFLYNKTSDSVTLFNNKNSLVTPDLILVNSELLNTLSTGQDWIDYFNSIPALYKNDLVASDIVKNSYGLLIRDASFNLNYTTQPQLSECSLVFKLNSVPKTFSIQVYAFNVEFRMNNWAIVLETNDGTTYRPYCWFDAWNTSMAGDPTRNPGEVIFNTLTLKFGSGSIVRTWTDYDIHRHIPEDQRNKPCYIGLCTPIQYYGNECFYMYIRNIEFKF